MKNLIQKGSILTNTNKIISDADADWRGIREGSLIKFHSDNITSTAIRIEPLFYIQDFETINNHTLLVKNNTSIFLTKGDNITLSYKEYELLTVFSILNGGRGYHVNDIVFLEGGVCSNNIEDGSEYKAHLRVADILPGGIITKLAIENKGKYIEIPASPKKINIKGGNGNGGIIEVDFKLLDSRALVERDIIEIIIGDKTIITLSYPISNAIREGKLSVKKQSLILQSNYLGNTKFSETFDIARDFTPNYGFPLLMQNSFSAHTVTNQSFQMIDKKIKDLEDEIKNLKKKKD